MGSMDLEHPWSLPVDQVLQKLDADGEQGLTREEADRRRKTYGDNRLREKKKRHWYEVLIAQFKTVVIGLLAVAAITAFAFGQVVEGVAILLALLINGIIGFVMEWRALKSMEALREMGQLETPVQRGGSMDVVPADRIVPGDIVLLESGRIVTADCRVVAAANLQTDEAALTGESTPVRKQVEPVEDDTPLAERVSMVFKGTAVSEGSGRGVVVTTGMETELGHVSSLVEQAEEGEAPIQERMDHLGRRLMVLTLIICALVGVSGYFTGKALMLILETAIALAVAAVPEGLPVVATVALAKGVRRMARRNALVEKLPAVETLGSTNVIITDKTGTLTENRMDAVEYWLAGGRVVVEHKDDRLTYRRKDGDRNDGQPDEQTLTAAHEAVRVGVLCNSASLDVEEGESTGDPMEVGLLRAGYMDDQAPEKVLEDLPREREVAFNADVKMMATYHRQNGHLLVAVKGAPEAVLGASTRMRKDGEDVALDDDQREEWKQRNLTLARDGLRVLALAEKTVEQQDAEPYEGLTFLGLVGLLDPPREEVRDALHACRDAGIQVVMITGDQKETALHVGKTLDLLTEEEAQQQNPGVDIPEPDDADDERGNRIRDMRVFARATPEAKMRLLGLHQKSGAVVAMLGDGVNDAPALKSADVGVAMGQRGTQVAQQASDIVLQDDSFATLVTAVRYGRVIFNNIHKFIIFLLSGNLSEILAVGVAVLLTPYLPLKPLQILYLNMIIDVFPALALGIGEGRGTEMQHPPRPPDQPMLTHRDWGVIFGYGVLIGGICLAGLYIGLTWLGLPEAQATTLSFLALALARLWHVLNMRDPDSPLVRNEITQNRWIWGAIGLSALLIVGAVYVPGLSGVLKLQPPTPTQWAIVLGLSLVPTIIVQAIYLARHHFGGRKTSG